MFNISVSNMLWTDHLLERNVKLYFQDRRGKFQEELNEYFKQLEDFQSFGDVAELHDYQKRAQALHNKLDLAAQYTDQINKEEEALGWNMTLYPLRKQVRYKLFAYDKLCHL